MGSVYEKMTAIANAIRDKTGNTEALSLDDMAREISNVFDKGRQEQRLEWWTNYLTDFEGDCAFYGNNWNDTMYDPPTGEGLIIKNSTKTYQNTYYNADLKNTLIPIDARGCKLVGTFRYSTIQTIPLLMVDEETVFNDSNVFSSAQVSITFDGTIASNLDLSRPSGLDGASVDNVIDALKKLEEGDDAKTLTLHATVKANMTDTQIAAIAEKGWTLA